jgi:KDO2-lipid IV(A) lauroyltransferase
VQSDTFSLETGDAGPAPDAGWETPGPAPAVPLAKRLKRGAGARVLLAALRAWGLLPYGAACALGRLLGALAWALSGGLRRGVLRNLAVAFQERDEAWRRATGRESLRRLGQMGAEVAQEHAFRRRADRLVKFAPGSLEVVRAAYGAGRGVIMATGHTGNWELLSQHLARCTGPVACVAREMFAPAMTAWAGGFRARGSIRTLFRRPGVPISDKLHALLAEN